MDFYNDTTKDQLCGILYTLQQNGLNPPNYVLTKAANEEQEDIAVSSYAYPEEKKFPMHTKADTWLSAAYFSSKQADLPKNAKERIKGMIHKGAELWDIPKEELARMDKILGPNLEKQADDNEVEINSEEDFHNYCQEALETFPGISLSQRQNLSNYILKTADEEGWNLGNDTRKKFEQSACRGHGHKEAVNSYLYNLKTRIPKHASSYHHILGTCINELDQEPHFPDPDKLAKTAALTDLIIQDPYSHVQRETLPERKIFQLSETEAEKAKANLIQLPGNKIVWKTALENNSDALKADISAITGRSPETTEDIIKELKNSTPVLNSKILADIEE